MLRRIFITAAAAGAATLTLVPGSVSAQERDMTAAEIKEMLSGNTIRGEWNGSAYTQYYAPDGATVYVPEGGKPDKGKWRVNPETDEYESWWRRTGWTPYAVVETADGPAWVDGGDRWGFKVMDGKQLPD